MKARVQHPMPWWPPDSASTSRSRVGIWPMRQRAAGKPTPIDRPALAAGERVLASDGGHLVATDLAFYHRDEPGWVRRGWEQIERADWDEYSQRLLLVGLTPGVPPVSVRVPAHSPLIAVVRERIGWTTLLTTDVALADLGKARVTVRRDPRGGELIWAVRLHPQVDVNDPELAERVDAAIRWLRA